jgi:hypothetical protein
VRSILGADTRSIGRGVVAGRASAAEVQSLRALNSVEAVEPDLTYTSAGVPNDPCYSDASRCGGLLAWQVDAMRLPAAWDLSKGAGATIAIIDGGVDEGYADLAGKLAAPEVDIVGAQAPGDPSDHATAIAALAAGNTDNGIGIPGVGWDAKLLSYRVLTSPSPGQAYSGRLSDIVNAIDQATDAGATVINLSITGPDSDALHTAISYAIGHGVAVVGAAGNEATSVPAYPAGYDGVISVGALDHGENRADFSNFGPSVDVFAPGDAIIAPGARDARGAERLLSVTGTSFSAALVSGAVALLEARTPGLSSAALSSILRASGPMVPAQTAPAVDTEQALRYRGALGFLDLFQVTPGGATMQGWTIDPDTTAPISVDISVDGVVTRIVANADRPDLAGFGLGTRHGFSSSMQLPRGTHTACAWGINDGRGGPNMLLGCRSLYVPSADLPYGSFDQVRRVPGGLRAEGWAIDPSTAAPAALDIWVNGVGPTRALATDARPDVAAVYPGFGPTRGFGSSVTAPAIAGNDAVCVWALDAPAPGINIQLGCRTIFVSNDPFGSLDIVARTPGGVRVVGWTIDPDVASPVDAIISIDGVVVAASPAQVARPDLLPYFPEWGAGHGFDQTFAAGESPHMICVTARSEGPGNDVSLGCRQI